MEERFCVSAANMQQGIRSIAADLCTRQLGYRTEIDAERAERREVTEKRFTLIDRRLLKDAAMGSQYFEVSRIPARSGLSEAARTRIRHDVARLTVLRKMGLAEQVGPNRWRLRRNFEQILRAMQRTIDRQKTLAAHGVVMSDSRLAIEALDSTKMTAVEGRVLVHGQEEQSGRNYLMLEGTDARVYAISYTPEIEEARSRGELRTNSFVRLRKLSMGRAPLNVEDLGDAEALLRNARYFDSAARQLLTRGIVPPEDGWAGWLGRYQAALRRAISEIEEQKERDVVTVPQRGRSRERSLGR